MNPISISGTDRNFQVLRGIDGNASLLSCTADGAKVDLWGKDDGSGRQKWNIFRVEGFDDVYNIMVSGGIDGDKVYLSCTPDGKTVDLWHTDDGSGRQRWQFVAVGSNVPDYYCIRVFGGTSGDNVYLSCTSDGKTVNLWNADDGSGRQRWQLQDLRSWMSRIGPGHYISELSIPGTHDSVTYVTSSINIYTKCQTLSLSEQLNVGIRYLDIRLKIDDDKLVYAHGPFTYDETFDLALKDAFDFLQFNPSEFVIMSVKNEADEESPEFQDLVERYFADPCIAEKIWRGTRLPTVKEARNQIIPLRRYSNYKNAANPPGIDISGGLWPKNTTGAGQSYLGEKFAIQDEYSPGAFAFDAKWEQIASMLDEARRSNEKDRLYINFLSATGVPHPAAFAAGMNERLKHYFEKTKVGRFGILVMDYPTDAPPDLGEINIRSIIQANRLLQMSP